MLPGEYVETDRVSYETRVVAFIDILGWGRMVEDSATSADLRQKLLNAVWALGQQSTKDAEETIFDAPSLDRATQFSDSVVISFPYSECGDLLRLVRQITSYQHTMLLLGLPLRGGITVGPLYHEGSLVFGPAMNEAYALERKQAIHPRVIIARSLDDEVKKAAALLPRHWPLVVMDEGGFYSTDFLMMFALSTPTKAHFEEKIASWLALHKDDSRVHAKYEWLKARWEAAKLDSQWRAEAAHQIRAFETDGKR